MIPELIRGLDADSFAARYDSARGLLEVSGQPVEQFSVDPSDSSADGAGGVRAWRDWRDASKARSAREKILQ